MYSIGDLELLDARRDVKVPTPEPEKFGLPKYPPDFDNSIEKRGSNVSSAIVTE